MTRTIVKICGITRIEDARVARAAGADWLGFVVKGESPRRVPAATAREILSRLANESDAHVGNGSGPHDPEPGAPAEPLLGVAVMVGPSPDEALRLATDCGAHRVQLHGVEASRWPADFPLPVAFAVPVADDGALMASLPPRPHLVLLDTADAVRAGGTGRTFPWFVAATVAAEFPVMVAGGLDDENVATMLTEVRPYGVDASSRLESAPGLKDAEKVRRFIAAVRAHDLGS